ncbi:MAG: RNA-protein complex protein Nop10 [Thermoplasmata archaeon]|nr:RNA-protein complex protein Nop10 [Thermoplasmata archaeon]
MGRIHVCPNCGKYSLKEECMDCKVKTFEDLPARFSPEDRYGKYRRRLKKENREVS